MLSYGKCVAESIVDTEAIKTKSKPTTLLLYHQHDLEFTICKTLVVRVVLPVVTTCFAVMLVFGGSFHVMMADCRIRRHDLWWQ